MQHVLVALQYEVS